MRSANATNRDPASVPVLVLLGLWALVQVTLGVMYAPSPSALVAIVTGGVTGLAVVTGVVRGSWSLALYGSMISAGGGMIAAGITENSAVVACLGLLGLIVTGAAFVIVRHVGQLLESERGSGGESRHTGGTARLEQLLEQINENSMLSESTRRVLYRDRELQLIRDVIDTDIAQGDYDAARSLCEELERVFGQTHEADFYRAKIEQVHQERYDAQAAAAFEALQQRLDARDWAGAHAEAARIKRLFPQSSGVSDIDQHIEQAREEHKTDLRERFQQAAELGEADLAMSLLRELDRYLSAEEAEALSETAQRVVTRHREQLGTSFSKAVAEKRWIEAVRIGETITESYPNSRMAEEVRSMLDAVRTRATEAAVATEGE